MLTVLAPLPPLTEHGRVGVYKKCDECSTDFFTSTLLEQFGALVCDTCRSKADTKHRLITKTTAKKDYLLEDFDLDGERGGLRCIEKKNPQHEHWGKMKLFLLSQVEAMAHTRYGGRDGLDAELDRRDSESRKRKEKLMEARTTKV